ncbi:hypothetical protein BT96DRAFT_791434, partial [Gymnopus androsaceus JB14]
IKKYKYAVFKSFSTLEEATNRYNEAKHTGIINLLADEPQPGDIYIVIEGVKPGVYMQRGTMMASGLDWRGGLAMVTTGTASQANAML